MSQHEPSPSQVDLRGFDYALAPFVRQQEWRMERLQQQLAAVQRELASARQQRNTLLANLHAQAGSMQAQLEARVDANAHQRGLAYLAGLRQRIHLQDGEIARLEGDRSRAQADCMAQQVKLDGLEEHRAGELRTFVEEATRREAAEADRDWIGRASLRAVPPATPVREQYK